MNNTSSLDQIFKVIAEFGGYFVLPSEDGTEFVVVEKNNYDSLSFEGQEVQLSLPEAECNCGANVGSADEMLEKINRDIALFRFQQDEQEELDLVVDEELSEVPVEVVSEDSYSEENTNQDGEVELPPPRRVRFEPLRGDLPPELQE